MNVITYALMAYGLTAVISLLVIAVILGINGIMSRIDENGED